MPDPRDKWDRIYERADASLHPEPCCVLKDHSYLLPASGRALDLACGLGGNALFLADHGLGTTAVDISPVAIASLQKRNKPSVNAYCTAVDEFLARGDLFDVIVVSNFLERDLCYTIAQSMAPGALLFYQTFVVDKVHPERGPTNPSYLLQSNELLSLFSGLHVLVFSDLATVGNTSLGLRDAASLVALRSRL